MTRDEAINELKCAIDLIKQDGKDWLDERDIPLLQMAIEALERKCGEWIAYNGDDPNWLRNDGSPVFMQCSECNTMVVNNFAFNWNYCPNCGAKMDEREEEQ